MQKLINKLDMSNSMIELKAKTKKWGNSVGIIIPKGVINIKPNKTIRIIIEEKEHKFMTVEDLMKLGRKHPLKFNESTQKLMEEIDKEFRLIDD